MKKPTIQTEFQGKTLPVYGIGHSNVGHLVEGWLLYIEPDCEQKYYVRDSDGIVNFLVSFNSKPEPTTALEDLIKFRDDLFPASCDVYKKLSAIIKKLS